MSRRFHTRRQERAVKIGADKLINLAEWKFRSQPRKLKNLRKKHTPGGAGHDGDFTLHFPQDGKGGKIKSARVGRRLLIPISELEKLVKPGAVSETGGKTQK